MRGSRTLSSILGSNRLPIAKIIERQESRLARLDVRIGALMTERVDEEDLLADMIRHRDALLARTGDK